MIKTLDPFKIRDHVADFEAISAQYEERSAVTRARHRHQLDLAYGPHPAEKLDVFFPETISAGTPVHMFVHGGYWRAGSKSDYTYMAEPVIASGGVAVIIDYALMPAVRMDRLVTQVRRAAGWVTRNAADWGCDPKRFTASGHSAGAHLASYLAAYAPGESEPDKTVNSLVLVSGIYDLDPIPHSFLQAEIGLTSGEVEKWSPLDANHMPVINRTILVGGDETTPFHTQADQLKAMLANNRTKLRVLNNRNHMSIILEMGDPESTAGRRIADCVADF